MFFKIPVKVSDERVVSRASVTTADTVEGRPSFALGAVPAEVLVQEHLLGGISCTE